jgi:hypothetical protein
MYTNITFCVYEHLSQQLQSMSMEQGFEVTSIYDR